MQTIKGSKIENIVQRASTSKVADDSEKSTLELALSVGDGFTEAEIVTAVLVLFRELAQASNSVLADLDTSPKEEPQVEVISKKKTQKANKGVEKTVKPGTVKLIDGVKKRYIGPTTKADGTQVKGYWMKVKN